MILNNLNIWKVSGAFPSMQVPLITKHADAVHKQRVVQVIMIYLFLLCVMFILSKTF